MLAKRFKIGTTGRALRHLRCGGRPVHLLTARKYLRRPALLLQFIRDGLAGANEKSVPTHPVSFFSSFPSCSKLPHSSRPTASC